jgi:hypothetical protein
MKCGVEVLAEMFKFLATIIAISAAVQVVAQCQLNMID